MEISQFASAPSRAEGLRREHLAACPFAQLERWLQEAIDHQVAQPAVMILATPGADDMLDQRAVMLEHSDPAGLVFFADDASKKISDARAHPNVSAYFPWYPLDRQLRIAGHLERIPAAQATRYLVVRPELRGEAQQGWDQQPTGNPVSRAFLMEQFETMKRRFHGGGGRRPGHWSAYRIVPKRFEFWQGGGPRLRDRFAYIAEAGTWRIDAIAG